MRTVSMSFVSVCILSLVGVSTAFADSTADATAWLQPLVGKTFNLNVVKSQNMPQNDSPCDISLYNNGTGVALLSGEIIHNNYKDNCSISTDKLTLNCIQSGFDGPLPFQGHWSSSASITLDQNGNIINFSYSSKRAGTSSELECGSK